MEELIRDLENTLDIIQIKIQQPGIELTLYSKVIDVTKFADGVSLSLDNESEIFVSSLINKVISSDVDDGSTEYTLVTPSKTIISILIAN